MRDLGRDDCPKEREGTIHVVMKPVDDPVRLRRRSPRGKLELKSVLGEQGTKDPERRRAYVKRQ